MAFPRVILQKEKGSEKEVKEKEEESSTHDTHRAAQYINRRASATALSWPITQSLNNIRDILMRNVNDKADARKSNKKE